MTGLCAPSPTIAYASPTGASTASCTRMDPCSIDRAFALTDAIRNLIKLSPGSYNANLVVVNKSIDVRADGATISSTTGKTLTINDRGSVHMAGGTIVASGSAGTAIDCATLNNVDSPSIALDGVHVESLARGLNLDMCTATIARSTIHVTGSSSAIGATSGTTASADRTSILGGGSTVIAASNAIVHLTNCVIGQPTSGSDAFFGVSGAVTVSFSTVINAVATCGTAAPACAGNSPNGVCFDNSIVANLTAGAPSNTITGAGCAANHTLVFPQSNFAARVGQPDQRESEAQGSRDRRPAPSPE